MFLRAMEKKRSGEGGFTLVELLIVIVILGILAAIVVLAIGGLSGTAQSATCNSGAKTIESAEDAYFAQNKDEFYAEAWSLFLCGENRPTLFRYLSRPLRRLRVRHPEAARLIEGCRQIV